MNTDFNLALDGLGSLHGFRAPHDHETEEDYRIQLANFVQPRDLIGSMEIRLNKFASKFTKQDLFEMDLRSRIAREWNLYR